MKFCRLLLSVLTFGLSTGYAQQLTLSGSLYNGWNSTSSSGALVNNEELYQDLTEALGKVYRDCHVIVQNDSAVPHSVSASFLVGYDPLFDGGGNFGQLGTVQSFSAVSIPAGGAHTFVIGDTGTTWYAYEQAFFGLGQGASVIGNGSGDWHSVWSVYEAGNLVGSADVTLTVVDNLSVGPDNLTVDLPVWPGVDVYPWGGDPNQPALVNIIVQGEDFRSGEHSLVVLKDGSPITIAGPVAGVDSALGSYTYQGWQGGLSESYEVYVYSEDTEVPVGTVYAVTVDGVAQGSVTVVPNTTDGDGLPLPDHYYLTVPTHFPGDTDSDDPSYAPPSSPPVNEQLPENDGPGELSADDGERDYNVDSDPNVPDEDLTKRDLAEAFGASLNGGAQGKLRVPYSTEGEITSGIDGDGGDGDNPYYDGPGGLGTTGNAIKGEITEGLGGVNTLLAGLSLPSGIPTGEIGTSLSFAVSLPLLGDQTIDLSPYSDYVAILRSLILLIACVVFYCLMVKVVRGAFAG